MCKTKKVSVKGNRSPYISPKAKFVEVEKVCFLSGSTSEAELLNLSDGGNLVEENW